MVLAAQISWSEDVEKALQSVESGGKRNVQPVEQVLQVVESTLNVLADSVLHEQPPVRRRKLEHLVRVCANHARTHTRFDAVDIFFSNSA